MAATGRCPSTAGPGLHEAGAALRADGAVGVDERMRRRARTPNAAGDVTGRDQFVYMAAYGARLAAPNARDGGARAYDNAAMPCVVFVDRQVAGIGASASAARARGIDVKASVVPLGQAPRAPAARSTA